VDCGSPLSDYEFRFVNLGKEIRNPQSVIRNPQLRVGGTVSDNPDADVAISDRQIQVQVLATSMTIHDLTIERPSVIEYLRAIAPDKQAIALVHAIEVGVTEMLARRERFKS
jgi:hypothetical protein